MKLRLKQYNSIPFRSSKIKEREQIERLKFYIIQKQLVQIIDSKNTVKVKRQRFLEVTAGDGDRLGRETEIAGIEFPLL